MKNALLQTNQEICKNCGSRLIQRATKRTAAQLKKPFYFRAYYFCPKCQKLYHSEQFKVINADITLPLELLQEENVNYDVEIWTDGACVFNGHANAKAAWAFVAGKTERSGSVEGKQTNNIAEAMAIYHAILWAAEKGHKKIKIYSDSQISINNVKKSPEKVKNNAEIFKMIANLVRGLTLTIQLEKVVGHSGDINNERADRLANRLAGRK